MSEINATDSWLLAHFGTADFAASRAAVFIAARTAEEAERETDMEQNLQDRSDAGGSAAIEPAGRYWEPWLSMWRANALLLVEPWDNAIRAFAERAQLLPRRVAAVGLDWDKTARVRPATVRQLVERCTTCESPEQCEWDLRQDPANPAWQAYCPNAATLMALARAEGDMTLDHGRSRR